MPTNTTPLVLYVYRCQACGHAGELHLAEAQPEVTTACSSCGAVVLAEWDGGVQLTTKGIASQIAALMPASDDRRMWRDYMATTLERVADSDDLSLLRAGKAADELEVEFMAFVSSFPGVQVVPAPEGGFYGVALVLAKQDRSVRREVLRAYAAELRKS